MMIGDLLASLGDETEATEAILSLGDINLLVALHKGAAAQGMTLGAFAAFAVRRYATEASDEEWLTLLGQLSRAPDPGLTFLQRVLAASRRQSPSP